MYRQDERTIPEKSIVYYMGHVCRTFWMKSIVFEKEKLIYMCLYALVTGYFNFFSTFLASL